METEVQEQKIEFNVTDENFTLSRILRQDVVSIEHFLQTGEYTINFDDDPVLKVPNHGTNLAIRSGLDRQKARHRAPDYEDDSGAEWLRCHENILYVNEHPYGHKLSDPVAIILPYKLPGIKEPEYFHLLVNGDMEDSKGNFVITGAEVLEGVYEFPTISFQCLNQLAWCKETTIVAIANGTLEVIDFVPDNIKKINEKQAKILRIWRRKKNPGVFPLKTPRGYTWISRIGILGNGVWHQAASVLIYDHRNKKSYLMGQDEDAYFGTELPSDAGSVQEAFELLVPDEAKNKIGVLRQGEWFAVPIPKCKVPQKLEDQIVELDYSQSCYLPHKENPHQLSADELIIGKDGGVYARNFMLIHDEHADLEAVGWFTFHRNSAVRSVSVDGMD